MPTSDLSRRTVIAAGAAAPLLSCAPPAAAAGPRVQLWAVGAGALAYEGEIGNPFATALIAAMADPAMSFAAACVAVQRGTSEIDPRMNAEVTGLDAAPAWSFARAAGEKRVALVAVFSQYSAAPPLPGAAIDGERMRAAFAQAGFETQLLVDPSREALPAALADFSARSARADVAALYSTGHGVEVGGVQYVMYPDHVAANGEAELARAALWSDIAAAPRAKKLNLTFWAGCRNNPYA
jgi:hypothetical protein